MPRFFIDPPAGEEVSLIGEDARHIAKSLRLRPGDPVTLCDGAGWDYPAVLSATAPDEVVARILEKVPNRTEPRVHIRLYQALPKGDKLDFIVQKAVELGVGEIIPVLTERCVSRPDPKSMAKKTARLEKIAAEAAKQAGRGRIPPVRSLQTYAQALDGMKTAPAAILFYEQATAPLSTLLDPGGEKIAILVGSEGGFSPAEAARAEEAGIAIASLGKRILRCETAPLCALSVLLYAFGEL